MATGRFDQFYLMICKEVGGIEGFVKSFFDFLARKTDFFYECDPGDKMGFPPGYNKQLIFGILDQFQKEHYKKFPQKTPEEFNRKLEQARAKNNQTKVESPKSIKVQQSNVQRPAQKKQQVSKVPAPKQNKPSSLQQSKTIQAQQQKSSKQPYLSTYNGGNTEKYTWSQQIREVEVAMQIDPSLTSKMLDVKLKSNNISIRKKTGELIIEGDLHERINAGESVWKIEKISGKNFITLNLEKAEQKIWSTVFRGDPQIDTSKVNNTKPLQEFDDETQGAIRKIMYEQQRKQMGLPTTEEEKQLEAIKSAWDAEGSPFKGKPFDPSLINFSGGQGNPHS